MINKQSYLIVGRAGLDLAPEPQGAGIDAAQYFSASLGGSAANIAAGLTRLGAKAQLFTCLSQDPVGDYCLQQLAAYEIGTDYVFRSAGQTRTSLALSEARIENHRTVIYRNQAADFEIKPEQANQIALSSISSVVVTGTALALEPSRAAVMVLFARAKRANIACVLDIDYRPYSWVSPQDASATLIAAAQFCEIVVGNEDEFDVMAGGKDLGLEFAQEFSRNQQSICVYKRGEKGSTTFHDANSFDVSILPAKPLKPTGAGDSFLAAFLVAKNAEKSLKEAVLHGSAAASMVVSRPGCAPAMPSQAELDQFLATHQPVAIV